MGKSRRIRIIGGCIVRHESGGLRGQPSTLVQAYTGLIYEGPAFVREVIAQLCKKT